MQFVATLLIAAAVFGVCFLVDKGFTKLFRSKTQHRSGMAVRANKKLKAMQASSPVTPEGYRGTTPDL